MTVAINALFLLASQCSFFGPLLKDKKAKALDRHWTDVEMQQGEPRSFMAKGAKGCNVPGSTTRGSFGVLLCPVTPQPPSARADSKLKHAALCRGESALMGKMPAEAREAAPLSRSWEWSHSENVESHAPRMQRLIGGSLVYTWQFIRGQLKSLVCRKSPVLGDGS